MTAQIDQIWFALPVPALLIGPDNKITRANPAAEFFLNIPERQALGRTAEQTFQTNTDLDAALSRARDGTSSLFYRDVDISFNERSKTSCDLQIAPLGDSADSLLVLMQPRHIESQLGNVLRVGRAAKTAIGLAEMLAHEIKNPLAGISGAAQLLSMSLSREDQEMTDLILQETRRIVDLLKQVEQFGDLREPNLKPLNIHDILERARKSAELGTAAHMTFRDDYDPSLPLISGDADQLLQVLANLFANAAEATRGKPGTISIRTFYEYGLRLTRGETGEAVPLHIEISDDGPGIPEGLMSSVFDPFISGRENGTGLGLALVSKIISAHRGTITVASRPGQTIFRISLPLAGKKQGPV